METLSPASPCLASTVRPSGDEIEDYARLILEHEGRPLSALPDCRREAELQLWLDRSLDGRTPRRAARRRTLAVAG